MSQANRTGEIVFDQVMRLLLAGGTVKVGPDPSFSKGAIVAVIVPREDGTMEDHVIHTGCHGMEDSSTIRVALSWALQQIGFPPREEAQ